MTAHGLPLDKLTLVPHDPQWDETFTVQSERLRSIASIAAIEHIGSTSLPDILAKPIVDIAAVAPSFDSSAVREQLLQAGYQCHGEYGLPGRMFYTLGDPPYVHLHVVSKDSAYWSDWLTFRDFLRNRPDWRQRYEQEKIRLQRESGGIRKRYTEMKSAFIASALKAAHAKE